MAGREFVNKKDRTPAYDAAVKALKKVPPDLRDRAFAEAASEEARKIWAESRQVTPAKYGQQFWGRLVGKRRPTVTTRNDLLPADDHFTLWLKDGRPEVYVSQPYDLSLDDLRQIVAACDQHGLTVSITTWPAWHFPSRVMQVEYRRAEPPSTDAQSK